VVVSPDSLRNSSRVLRVLRLQVACRQVEPKLRRPEYCPTVPSLFHALPVQQQNQPQGLPG
jgi:hypothetical protein